MRTIARWVACGLILGLCGCGGDENETEPVGGQAQAPEAGAEGASPSPGTGEARTPPEGEANGEPQGPEPESAPPDSVPFEGIRTYEEPTSPEPATAPEDPGPARDLKARLRDPGRASEKAPESFTVAFETTEGTFKVACKRALGPPEADRLYNLVKLGYFEQVAVWRYVSGKGEGRQLKGRRLHFGIHGDPTISAVWSAGAEARLPDEPVTSKLSIATGVLGFDRSNGGKAASELVLGLSPNPILSVSGYRGIGQVVDGTMTVVEKLCLAYGEEPKRARILSEGNSYLKSEYPDLPFILSARIVSE